ncbi:MAG TPA: hypothetical protein VI754_11525 [Bacteriovoracaceae bacterium]|nr:hypothetical protein [Bacteriovoracaceae bacterium]
MKKTIFFIPLLLFSFFSTANECIDKIMPFLDDGTRELVLAEGKIVLDKKAFDLIESVKETGDLFRNEKFWDFFSHPGQEELVDKLLATWYPRYSLGDKLSEKISNARHYLKHRYSCLLLDPGIISRIDHFFAFALDYSDSHPDISTHALREAYSEHLGKRIVWRGIAVSDDTLIDNIKKEGFKAHLFLKRRQPGDYRQERHINSSLVNTLLRANSNLDSPTPLMAMSQRLSQVNIYGSTYISISQFIEVTYAGAWLKLNNTMTKVGNKFYLFKLNISNLNIIDPTDPYLKNFFQDRTAALFTTQGINGSGDVSFATSDPGFEMFVQRILPEDMEEIIPYDSYPSTWRASSL